MTMKLNWKSVTYVSSESNNQFSGWSDKNGVYVITKNKSIPCYVGRGKIDDRMSNHEKNGKNHRLKILMSTPYKNGVRVFYALCNIDDSKRIERTLYDKYGKKEKLYNEIEPTGEPLNDIELPNLNLQ